MIFRLALFKEKEIILNMYNENRNKSYTAWNDTYPTIDNILKDIETNNLYVLEVNNEIAGSISINYENEPTIIKSSKIWKLYWTCLKSH